MKTFEKYNLTYKSLCDTDNHLLSRFLKDATRDELIKWLSWNDRNGVYSDEDSLREFGSIMTKEEAVEIVTRQIIENRLTQ